ncbi:MAG: LysR family transcriptional regulator [Pseudonocardiaceae bacterium]
MDDIEVRELRFFVAVAEELNFSRAAERLGMAQPPLSRAIRQMERRLGVQLFERNTRQVTMTVAGQALLNEAGNAFDVLSAAVRRTRRAALPTPTLVVTAKPGLATGLLKRIVTSYSALPGTPQVELVVSGYREQANMVRDGSADLALLSSPYDERGLAAEPLTTEPRVAALPAGHELAGWGALRCRDLDGWPVPQWPDSSPVERRYWSGRDRDSSAKRSIEPPSDLPAHGPVVRDSTQLLEVVGLGQALALIPLSLAERNPRADVVYRPVGDASPYTTVIVWPEGARAHSVALFVRAAIRTAHEDNEAYAAEVS